MIAYSIAAALESDVFDAVVVSTDGEEIAAAAARYGAEVPELRPTAIATATSPDIEWVAHVMSGRDEDVFSILRPTSPFRQAETIRRAHALLVGLGGAVDSVRAVEPVRQHPGKMWIVEDALMRPLLPQPEDAVPYHSSQFQSLPTVYVQNSSLEVAWSRVLDGPRPTISGTRVAPFFTTSIEGFTIDYPDDVDRAEELVASGAATLPLIREGRP
jgi:CMP-N-acetylneuraminic acid synthetase